MAKEIWSGVTLVLGTLLVAIGLESFLIPNHFIDGGITGVSMLIAELWSVPLTVILVLVNIPFVLMAYRQIGPNFAIKSSLAIVGLSFCLFFVHFPEAPLQPSSKILAAIFGGFFVGAGVGLAMRSGGVLDGTEILAVILSNKTFATVGEVILLLNVGIFSIAAIFLGIESALYSMLTYFAASKTIDYLLHGIEAYNGVLIVTKNQQDVRQSILTEMGRGVTAFKAKGGYSDTENEVLFCVVTRLEITKLENLILSCDPNAFIVIQPVLDIKGGVVKQRSFH